MPKVIDIYKHKLINNKYVYRSNIIIIEQQKSKDDFKDAFSYFQ